MNLVSCETILNENCHGLRRINDTMTAVDDSSAIKDFFLEKTFFRNRQQFTVAYGSEFSFIREIISRFNQN